MWPFTAMSLVPHKLDLQAGEVEVEEDIDTVMAMALNASTVGSVGIQRWNAGLREEGRKVKDHEEKGRKSRRSQTQRLWLLAQMQPPV